MISPRRPGVPPDRESGGTFLGSFDRGNSLQSEFKFLLATLCLISGCANVSNFTDPKGPGLLVSYAPPPADPPDTLRVVTFNVRFAREVDKAIEVLSDTPELEHADFIALQEMDDRAVDRIARALSMNAVYYAASIHPATGRPFGPALLSRWPIERGWKILLPHQSSIRAQRRVATAALVRVGKRRVRVYALHLEAPYRLTERDRRDQARAVIDDATTWAGPVIVAGDMNDEILGEVFEESGYTWATKGIRATMGPLAFDHVFTRDLGPVIASGKADAKGASDHRPVWAEVIFSPAP